MYKKIGQHPGTRKLYADKLETQGVLPQGGPTRWSRTCAPRWTPASTRPTRC
jgi:2-oxoglutarate dehydrogenase complex dehydrogenase (E1) component-like enzyme